MDGLSTFGAAALVAVFVASAMGKVRNPRAFSSALESYGWIPAAVRSVLIPAVPAIELVLVAGLVFPATRVFAAWSAAAVLLAFAAVLVRALVEGRKADCGCFGSSQDEPVSWFSVARNALLIALATGCATAGTPESFIVVPAAFAGIGIALVIVLVDRTVATFRRHWIGPEQVRG
jgi:hypothetical protein